MSIAWIGNGVICGVLGLLLSDIYRLDATSLTFFIIPALAAAVIGQLRNLVATFVAGLVIGNYGETIGMSATDRNYLYKFWELIDEILNAILFLIIGFELLLIPELERYWLIGSLSILVVLTARFLSIWLPIRFVPRIGTFDRKTILILVWGGLRGGVSVALALTIDPGLHQNLFLSITYYVVVFSIVVQGLTIGGLTKVINRK